MLGSIIDSLSSREQAQFILYLAIFIIAIYIVIKGKIPIKGVIDSFMTPYIIVPILIVVLYICLGIFILGTLGFWDMSLFKDTLLSFIIPLGLLYKINDANSFSYFKKISKESFKLSIIIQFVVDFSTMDFYLEFILLIIITYIQINGVFVKEDSRNKGAFTLFRFVTAWVGYIYMIYTVCNLLNNWQKLITLQSLKSFLLPIYVLIIYMPLLYILALYKDYELMAFRVNFYIENKKERALLMIKIFVICKFNLNKINNLVNHANNLYYKDLDAYLREKSVFK